MTSYVEDYRLRLNANIKLMQGFLTEADYTATRRTVTINAVTFQTEANIPEWDKQVLTDEFRHLIYRCMAVDPKRRPSPREALAICENAVHNKTAADYSGLPNNFGIYETDAVVSEVVKTLILDADIDAQQQAPLRRRRRTVAYMV